MARRREPTKRQINVVTYRQRVLDVIEYAPGSLTGHDVAELTGLTYRQTIDALNALFNMAKIARTGRKFTARWGKLVETQPKVSPVAMLDRFLLGLNR